jgi:hypothetical protein
MQRLFFFLQARTIQKRINNNFEAKSARNRNNPRSSAAISFDRLHARRFEDSLSPKLFRPIPQGVPGDTFARSRTVVPEEERDVRSSRV